MGRGGRLRSRPAGGPRRALVRAARARPARSSDKIKSRERLGALDAGHAARRPAARRRHRMGQAEPRRLHAMRRGPEDSAHRPGQASTRRPPDVLGEARWYGAGWPDYPWIFATDGEYTAFAGVALGQFEATMDHMRALRDISDIANRRSGKVVHEIMPDGVDLVRREHRRREHRRDGQVPEHRRAAVALDRRRPVPRRDVRLRPPQPALRRRASRRRRRRLARRASATSSARAWARRSSTTPSTTSAGCTTSPTSRAPRATGARTAGRRQRADDLFERFEDEWWMETECLYADSLGADEQADPAASLDHRHADGVRADDRRARRSRA